MKRNNVDRVEYQAGSYFDGTKANYGEHPYIKTTVYFRDGTTQTKEDISPESYLYSSAAKHAAEREIERMARESGYAYTKPREWEPSDEYAGLTDYTRKPAQKRANKASTRPPEGGARWVWVLLVVISFAVMIARSISGG